MPIEVEHGGDGKQQRHAQQTKHLEVDPYLLRQVEGDIGVGGGGHGKEARPRQIDPTPDGIRQLHLLAQHLLDQRLFQHELADQQGSGEEQVDDGHLPLDEGIIVEEEGEAAEDQHHGEGDEVHLLQLAQGEPGDGDLQYGYHHQGGGGGVDVIELVDREEHQQGNKVEKLFHAWTSSKSRPQSNGTGRGKKAGYPESGYRRCHRTDGRLVALVAAGHHKPVTQPFDHLFFVATIQVYLLNNGYDWHPQSIADGLRRMVNARSDNS